MVVPPIVRRASLVVLVLVLAVALTGCGEDDVVADGGPEVIDPGARRGGLFVAVAVEGGFAPVGQDLRSLPDAAIYGDGTTLSPGAVVPGFPGPAVLPVVEGRIGDDELGALASAARDAGLVGEEVLDVGDPPVADAPTTTITVVVDGEEHTTSVEALGEVLAPLPGLGPAQLRTRERIAGFVDLVSRVVGEAGGDAYQPTRYRVTPLDPSLVGGEGDEVGVRSWPFPELDLEVGTCTVVGDEHADAFADALDGATEVTRWRTAAGEEVALVVRPVLPHEPGCPEPA